MKWIIYTYDSEAKKIDAYNIFEHCTFIAVLKRIIQECKTRKKIKESLNEEMKKLFRGKFWNVVISDVNKRTAIEIDAYQQIKENLDSFVEYIWSNRTEIMNIACINEDRQKYNYNHNGSMVFNSYSQYNPY